MEYFMDVTGVDGRRWRLIEKIKSKMQWAAKWKSWRQSWKRRIVNLGFVSLEKMAADFVSSATQFDVDSTFRLRRLRRFRRQRLPSANQLDANLPIAIHQLPFIKVTQQAKSIQSNCIAQSIQFQPNQTQQRPTGPPASVISKTPMRHQCDTNQLISPSSTQPPTRHQNDTKMTPK